MLRSVCLTCIFFAAIVAQAQKPNILFICVDDLRPELGCYGADYMQTPNIDSLAEEGQLFTHHYVQAPTCGASRYALLTGMYGPDKNDALFKRATKLKNTSESLPPSMPEWFKEHGYTTVAIGKISHHPGGLGGPDWNDPSKPELPNAWDRSLMPVGDWQSPKGAMHALANGEIRNRPSQTDVYQSHDGPDASYPDGLIKKEAIHEINTLAKGDKPFFLAVGFIRPHLPFGSPAEYMEPYAEASLPPIPHPEKPEGLSTWHPSNEFMKYNRWDRDPNNDAEFAEEVHRHYAACVTYIDQQIGDVLAQLKADGLDKNTIIVLWGDHGWHLGEHAIWGKHALFEESLRAPLILVAPGNTAKGKTIETIVETIDIYPTLCELAGLPVPADIDGQSLKNLLLAPSNQTGTAASYYNNAITLRTETHRLIAHENGPFELYDHRADPGETNNIAEDQPELVTELNRELQTRLANRPK